LSSVLDIKKEAKRISSAIFWIVYIVVLTVVSWISAKINAKSIREMVQLQFTVEKLKLRAEEMRRQLYDKDKEDEKNG
jgi:hypothetical protein